jgi:hypothetical protein
MATRATSTADSADKTKLYQTCGLVDGRARARSALRSAFLLTYIILPACIHTRRACSFACGKSTNCTVVMCEEVLPLVTYPHWPSLGPKHLVAIGSLKPASNRSAAHYCKLLCSAEPRCQSYVIAPARSRQSNHTLVPSCKLHVCSGALSQSPLRPPAARLVHTTPHSMHLVPPWEVHVYAAAQAIDHSLACRVQSVDDVGVYSS